MQRPRDGMSVDGGKIARNIGDQRVARACRAAHTLLVQVGEFRQFNRSQRSSFSRDASRDLALVEMFLDLGPVLADVFGQAIKIDGIGY